MASEFNIPNKKNYKIMAGTSVFIAQYDSNDVLGDYNLMGNLAEDVALGFELERVENNTSLYGLKTRDFNRVIGKKMDMRIVINELVRHNLRYALGSSGRVASQNVNVPKYEKVIFAADAGEVNSGSAINSILRIIPNQGDDTYDEGATADYTVNLPTGAITLTGSSNISNGDTCIVIYDVATTVSKFPIMDDPNIVARIKFLSSKSTDNDVGNNTLIDLTRCDVALDGDITLTQGGIVQATLLCSVSPDETNPTGPFGYWYDWR